MATTFNKVSPGDLITAELMNKIMETIEALDQRLATIETATKGSISGTVKDLESGLPIVGSVVKAVLGNASYNSTPTDSQGIYTIPDLIAGDYTVLAVAENYLDSPAHSVGVTPAIPVVANFLLNRSAGLVVVPKLFGLTVSQAATVVGLPSVNLAIGKLITSHGSVFGADEPAAQSRIVLNQVPDVNTAVATGTAIDLVVTAAADSGGVSTGEVVILGFVPPPTVGRAIGEDITITGKNFEIPVQNNTVTIGGVQVISPDGSRSPFLAGSGSERLIFRVPVIPGITGSRQDVDIVVVNSKGEARFEGYPISPATTAEPPQVFEVMGTGPVGSTIDKLNMVRIGAPFRIIGANFSLEPEDNEIVFSSGELIVNIPVDSIDVSSESEISVKAFPTFTPLPTISKPRNFILSIRVGGILGSYASQVRAYPAPVM
ncbi:MAG: carboxypeptidase regulatory-like domain-containing protein [bacterium]|nr:carboxypeptidase regulatory-like domain-containing protein [bacterium]